MEIAFIIEMKNTRKDNLNQSITDLKIIFKNSNLFAHAVAIVFFVKKPVGCCDHSLEQKSDID